VNFENIYNSIAALFIVTTLEGYLNIMELFADGDSYENGPNNYSSS